MAYKRTSGSFSSVNQISSTPFTVAFFFMPTALNGSSFLSYWNAGTSNYSQYYNIYYNPLAQGRLSMTAVASGVNGAIDSNFTPSTSNWNHCAGVFSATNSRSLYANGVLQGSSAVNVNPTSLTTSSFCNADSSVSTSIAEIGIWNAALTAAEIASLAKGMTCDKVRPQSLVFYAPLVRDLIDAKGGRTITNNNGATVANHPRIYP